MLPLWLFREITDLKNSEPGRVNSGVKKTNMGTMNFYSPNGWAGSNYDPKLTISEIATKVRSFAKAKDSKFKISVKSEWSMYADSLFIELKASPCAAFIDGSKSAERGYMYTMSTVKGWEKELTPEVYTFLDAVSTFANSFRYDDSDAMRDYFDTNFYLKIKISANYKVSFCETKKTREHEGFIFTAEELEVIDYSEKAIAVFGNTKDRKDVLKGLGGRFNKTLSYKGEKRPGWVFSKKHAEKLRELV